MTVFSAQGRRVGTLALVLGLVLWPAVVGGQSAAKPLTVALYAPDVAFASSAARYAYVTALAAHLGKALQRPVAGRAYKQSGDFDRDWRAGRISVAVVGSLKLAAGAREARVIASAAPRRTGVGDWTIMSATADLARLKNQVLQVPMMGPLTPAFLRYVLFADQLDPRSYFKLRLAPDLAAAVAAVRLGRAAAVLAPAGTAGLRAVIGPVELPPPVLAVLDPGLSAAEVQAIRQAALAFAGPLSAEYGGFRVSGTEAYRALAAAARRRQRAVVLLPVGPERLAPEAVVDTRRLACDLEPLDEALWVP
ncbi:MAG: hypothetical protein IPG96_09500 [Proteobacteria bacterium]|nr:hypothetical protein [Pseudomonadota bacterium]